MQKVIIDWGWHRGGTGAGHSPADGGSAPVSSPNSLAAPLWPPCAVAYAASRQFSSRI